MAFRKAAHESAYLKMGMYGEMGTGKTYTACEIAIGLHKYLRLTSPVYFLDSEKGSDFHVRRFEEAGIELQVDKTRSFATLVSDIEAIASSGAILIIDSISHFWLELMAAYKRKRKRTFLSLYDFGPLKEEWGKYNALFLNSKLHIIECGRSSDITIEEEVDEGEGETRGRITKIGTRMAAEKNTAYEPDLLVEMTREMLHAGGRYRICATILKDRFGVVMGQTFVNPTFNDFLPYIKQLNLGGEHLGFTPETSERMLENPDQSLTERRRLQAIAMEELEALKAKYLPGSTARERSVWTVVREAVFGTASDTAISGLDPVRLQAGIGQIQRILDAYDDLQRSGALEGKFATLKDFRLWAEQLVRQGEERGAPSEARSA